jgi:hypothetical protein
MGQAGLIHLHSLLWCAIIFFLKRIGNRFFRELLKKQGELSKEQGKLSWEGYGIQYIFLSNLPLELSKIFKHPFKNLLFGGPSTFYDFFYS